MTVASATSLRLREDRGKVVLMLRQRSGSKTAAPSTQPAWSTGARVPDGHRVYAIGDIHGRCDLLLQLHRKIVADVRARPGPTRRTLVYLGDYIDRGASSFDVLDVLIHAPLEGFERVHLRGNHEDLMLRFLSGRHDAIWLHNGGDATLASYGLLASWMVAQPSEMLALRDRLHAAMPSSHLAFLQALRLWHVSGDYYLVHAGVRPGVPLDRQRPADLVWIREPFLLSDDDFGKRVVHGHTITSEPDVRANRIGIDTGAFCTGRLTCLVLEGTNVGFLST